MSMFRVLTTVRAGLVSNRTGIRTFIGRKQRLLSEDMDQQRPRFSLNSLIQNSGLMKKQNHEQTQQELANMVKGQPIAVQIKLLSAYKRGLTDSLASQGATSRSEAMRRWFLRPLLMAMLGYIIYRYYTAGNDMKAFTLKKFFDSEDDQQVEVKVNVSFKDVRGCDEEKKELQDIVDFLKNPEKYNKLGARLPKGVLLSGPPGVGKTLLAKAVAGEAGVPFLYASGSSFEEIFVGMGANKVRQLFSKAKLQAPCVIFIDEIDSVGRNRTSSPLHPYANQTINQLLAEMDGFQSSEGIIVLGATNQLNSLDSALTRPGRFDMSIVVNHPNARGRMALFELYLGKVRRHPTIHLEQLAHKTVGFTGADIQNMVNQAAIKAGLNQDQCVTMEHLWEAHDRIMMGTGKARPVDEMSNKITAYHEAGHALASLNSLEATPMHKVTIIPRGVSGGHTCFLDDKEISYFTKAKMLAQLDVSMAGRAAEEIIFGKAQITNGASGDFQQSTRMAEQMVQRFGFSDVVGPQNVADKRNLSQETQNAIDKEVTRLLHESYARALSLLRGKENDLHKLAQALLTRETLTKQEVLDLLANKPPIVGPSNGNSNSRKPAPEPAPAPPIRELIDNIPKKNPVI